METRGKRFLTKPLRALVVTKHSPLPQKAIQSICSPTHNFTLRPCMLTAKLLGAPLVYRYVFSSLLLLQKKCLHSSTLCSGLCIVLVAGQLSSTCCTLIRENSLFLCAGAKKKLSFFLSRVTQKCMWKSCSFCEC